MTDKTIPALNDPRATIEALLQKAEDACDPGDSYSLDAANVYLAIADRWLRLLAFDASPQGKPEKVPVKPVVS